MAQALNWTELIARLKALKAPIDREIRGYPTPIAGCNAHFNYLLEERAKLARELIEAERQALENASENGVGSNLEAFVQRSEYLKRPAG